VIIIYNVLLLSDVFLFGGGYKEIYIYFLFHDLTTQ
jgi:hypothetical protein